MNDLGGWPIHIYTTEGVFERLSKRNGSGLARAVYPALIFAATDAIWLMLRISLAGGLV